VVTLLDTDTLVVDEQLVPEAQLTEVTFRITVTFTYKLLVLVKLEAVT
jgi:hypothetical protein